MPLVKIGRERMWHLILDLHHPHTADKSLLNLTLLEAVGQLLEIYFYNMKKKDECLN